jgi:hypothetical protein
MLKKMQELLYDALNKTRGFGTDFKTTSYHTLYTVISRIYEFAILSPLARLYLHGPSWGSIGFWNGVDINIICAQKTQLSVSFWENNSSQCLTLISKQFYGIVVMFETIFYFFMLWVVMKTILFYIIFKCNQQNQQNKQNNQNKKE